MKKARKYAKRGVALTAGAAAAGMGACTDGTTVCDPPPPPLCDALDVDSSLRLEASPATVTLEELILFTGGIDSTNTATIHAFDAYAQAGHIVDLSVIEPDSLSFTWSPKETNGGFQSGTHEIRLWLSLTYAGTEGGRSCVEEDTVRVVIDAEGNATVLSLPGSSPLGTFFHVELETEDLGGAFLLRAVSSLPPERTRDLQWTWRCEGGTLAPDGSIARFTPDLDGTRGLVQVEARLGTRGLAVSSWQHR